MRIDATDPKMPEWRKYLFPCDCHDGTYMEFSWWIDDRDPPMLEITPTVWGTTLFGRIKGAIKLVFGFKYYGTAILLVDEDIDALIEATNEQKNRKVKNGQI